MRLSRQYQGGGAGRAQQGLQEATQLAGLQLGAGFTQATQVGHLQQWLGRQQQGLVRRQHQAVLDHRQLGLAAQGIVTAHQGMQERPQSRATNSNGGRPRRPATQVARPRAAWLGRSRPCPRARLTAGCSNSCNGMGEHPGPGNQWKQLQPSCRSPFGQGVTEAVGLDPIMRPPRPSPASAIHKASHGFQPDRSHPPP
ncbi:hypothetical protein D3C85_1281390 [compost metagenome]